MLYRPYIQAIFYKNQIFVELKGFFKKIFGIEDKKVVPQKEEVIEDIPMENFSIKKEPELPLEERFADNFTKSGGKFIFCENQEEVISTIVNIISENSWDEFLSFTDDINDLLQKVGVQHSDKTNKNSAFFTKCEALIAHDGSILISSNQLKGRKLQNLPYDFIILSEIGHIIENRSDALGSLIRRYDKDNIPSGITTVKGPKTVTGTDNILDSGSINTSKNIYLLLVE